MVGVREVPLCALRLWGDPERGEICDCFVVGFYCGFYCCFCCYYFCVVVFFLSVKPSVKKCLAPPAVSLTSCPHPTPHVSVPLKSHHCPHQNHPLPQDTHCPIHKLHIEPLKPPSKTTRCPSKVPHSPQKPLAVPQRCPHSPQRPPTVPQKPPIPLTSHPPNAQQPPLSPSKGTTMPLKSHPLSS